MVDATVGFAIEKLSDFLTQEVNTRIGVKDGVRWLKDELSYLQSSVRAAEERQELDLIRIWINNIRDVANDAVIILERFSTLQEEHSYLEQGVLNRLRRSIFMCRKQGNIYDIGKEIESLKARVAEIKNRRVEYGITDVLATPMMQQKKRTLLKATSFENQVDVVGLEDNVETLLAELVSEDPSLRVISIHGMGGLGKTTLASKLYHSSELSHFETRAWVCVSQEYSIKDVLKRIIKSFVGHELEMLKMEEVDLLRHLRKLLQDRDSYLAVIDDIWDIGTWERIKTAFPDKKNGSRVIITTRNKKVAQRIDDRCFVHELRFLTKDESWQLFCKRAKPTPNLNKLGMEMVGKCGGLPLAIMILSGLLIHKKSYKDWSKVKDHIWRELKGDSVKIQEILKLSYDDLSFQMRQCFLYLSRFPEDYNFEVTNIKLLWIAEEFISEADEGDGVVMEHVAEDYLNELINRNMIQITRLELNGEVSECKLHDLIRDLAIQKAKEQKLLGFFDSSKQHTSPIHLVHGQTRHVIDNEMGEYLKLLKPGYDDLKLRSLALNNESGSYVEMVGMKLICGRFRYLKVLDLTHVGSERIPKEIGNLVLLKFLGLIGCISEQALVIPPTIGKLKKLQTLCGSFSSKYIFPREVCELKELRHLKFGYFFQTLVEGRLNIGSHQTKLQTLPCIWYEEWIQIDTVNLTNLHTLVIANDSIKDNGYKLDSVSNLTSLQTFVLQFHTDVIPTIKPLSSCKRLKSVVLIGTMKDPSDLSFLPDSITDLTLQRSNFTQDPMPVLGSFPNLTALYLIRVFIGEKMVCSCGKFPSLQILFIINLPNLEEWQVDDGALSSIKGFQMEYCDKLQTVPQRLECVPSVPDKFRFWNLGIC